MYARVTTVKAPGVTDEQMDRAVTNYREIVPPGAKQLEGFEQAMMLVDRDQDTVVSITMWRDEECCNAGFQNAARLAQEVMQKSGISGDVTMEAFEVAVQSG